MAFFIHTYLCNFSSIQPEHLMEHSDYFEQYCYRINTQNPNRMTETIICLNILAHTSDCFCCLATTQTNCLVLMS